MEEMLLVLLRCFNTWSVPALSPGASPVPSPVLVFVLSRQVRVSEGYLGCKLTDVNHLLQTLGTDSVQTAQQFGFPAAGVVAVVADFALQFLQSVDQRLSPRLNLNAAQGKA